MVGWWVVLFPAASPARPPGPRRVSEAIPRRRCGRPPRLWSLPGNGGAGRVSLLATQQRVAAQTTAAVDLQDSNSANRDM